jgi:hypothetical protein
MPNKISFTVANPEAKEIEMSIKKFSLHNVLKYYEETLTLP